jgi:hypothetical protein
MSTQSAPNANAEITQGASASPQNGKVSRTLRFSEAAYAAGLRLAEQENRSFNNLVEVLILRAGGKIVEGPGGVK